MKIFNINNVQTIAQIQAKQNQTAENPAKQKLERRFLAELTKPEADTVSFKRIDFDAAKTIQNRIAQQKGIEMNVHGNVFVAECYEKVINIFEKLFKKSYLPSYLGTEKFNKDNCLGQYNYTNNSINVNEDLDFTTFYDMDTLKKSAQKDHNNIILPNWASSNHPAHTFVHEFSHAAHWHHLKECQGYDNAEHLWFGLVGTRIPNAIGRLIAKFKISKYAVGTARNCDMCEFLAERMAKDICENITNEKWIPYKDIDVNSKDIDVNYSDIFNRKWNYRYSRPQSYIDYFTQQVWNGNIEEANRVGEIVEEYLAELEAERVPQTIQIAETITEGIPLLGRVTRFLSRVSENITDILDSKNKLKINQ